MFTEQKIYDWINKQSLSTTLPVKHRPYNQDILTQLHNLVLTTTWIYPKSKILRFDLRFPDECNPNAQASQDAPPFNVKNDKAVITRFIRNLKYGIRSYLDTHSKSVTAVPYLWVKENSEERGIHYHVVIGINAFSFKGFGYYDGTNNLAFIISQAWSSALGIKFHNQRYVHFCNEHFLDAYQAKRVLKAELQDTIKHISYLAKEATKLKSHGLRQFGHSNFDKLYWQAQAQQLRRRGA